MEGLIISNILLLVTLLVVAIMAHSDVSHAMFLLKYNQTLREQVSDLTELHNHLLLCHTEKDDFFRKQYDFLDKKYKKKWGNGCVLKVLRDKLRHEKEER